MLSIFKTFVSFLRGILPIILACIVSFAVCFVFFFPPSITFPVLWRLENECLDSCVLKGNGSERVDTCEGRKGLVSTALKNGGRCRVMKLQVGIIFYPPKPHRSRGTGLNFGHLVTCYTNERCLRCFDVFASRGFAFLLLWALLYLGDLVLANKGWI